MNQKYAVQLTEAERYQLKQMLSAGTSSARKIRRAQIMLKSDSSQGGLNWSYQVICEAFNVSQPTISEVRRLYVTGGVEAALHRKKPDRMYEHRLDVSSGGPSDCPDVWQTARRVRTLDLTFTAGADDQTLVCGAGLP